MMREQMIRSSVARLTGAEEESIGVLAGLNLTFICGLGSPSAREALRIEQALAKEFGTGSIKPGMVRFV